MLYKNSRLSAKETKRNKAKEEFEMLFCNFPKHFETFRSNLNKHERTREVFKSWGDFPYLSADSLTQHISQHLSYGFHSEI